MELSREERIREYAYAWYEFRVQNNRPGNHESDWRKAEHLVDSEEKVKIREENNELLNKASSFKE